MLDKIKSKIADAQDKQKVFRLLLHTEEPLMVLRMLGDSESISGNIWIRDGKTIVGTFVTPSGESGMLGMLRLLSIKEARFELADAMIQPQGDAIDLSLEDLVEDEGKTIATIKERLWPATSEEKTESVADKSAEQSSEVSAAAIEEPALEVEVRDSDEVALDLDTKSAEENKPSDELSKSIEDFGTEGGLHHEKCGSAEPASLLDSHAGDATSGLFGDSEQKEGTTTGGKSSTQEPGQSEPATLETALKLVLESDPELAAMLDDDRLGDKRRADLSELPDFIAEKPSNFYEKVELPGIDEEELRKKRTEELVHAAGSAESKEAFYGEADPDRTQDVDLNVFRQRLYESAKEIVGESDDKFYESPVPLNDPTAEAPLNDLQKGVLAAMGDFSDKEGFEESHPALSDNESVFPILEADPNVEGSSLQAKLEEILAKAPDLPPSPELEQAEEPATDLADRTDPSISKRRIVTQYDEAANLATGQKAGLQFENKPAEDSLGLIKRAPLDAGREVAIAPESLMPRQRFNKRPYIIAAAIGVIGLPLAVLVIHNYSDAKAQEDIAMQREASLLAERSIEKESVTAKPQEPFRMPAAASNGPPPPSAHSADASAPGIADSERSQNFEYHEPQAGQTTMTSAQVSAADGQMQRADAIANSGRTDQAVNMYMGLIRQYPSYAVLRAKAARAYISMKQYREAYNVCLSGLDHCTNRSDFDMLVSVIREIP